MAAENFKILQIGVSCNEGLFEQICYTMSLPNCPSLLIFMLSNQFRLKSPEKLEEKIKIIKSLSIQTLLYLIW